MLCLQGDGLFMWDVLQVVRYLGVEFRKLIWVRYKRLVVMTIVEDVTQWTVCLARVCGVRKEKVQKFIIWLID